MPKWELTGPGRVAVGVTSALQHGQISLMPMAGDNPQAPTSETLQVLRQISLPLDSLET